MKVATAEDASSAPVVALEMEVALPDGFDLPDLANQPARAATSSATVELDELDDRAARSPATAPRTADPVPQNDRERQLLAARNEERRKRKTLATKYQELERERDALRSSQTAQANTTPSLLVRETPEQKQDRKAKLLAAAREKDRIEEVVELVFDHFDGRLEKRLEDVDRSFVSTINSTKGVVDEKIFRSQHADYDDLLRKAGIFDALTVLPGGTFKDPVIARKVYTSPNYAQAAYDLAQQKLAHEAELAADAGVTRDPADGTRSSVAPSDVEAAEVRGRRQAFEEVAETANRGRGIRHLPNASGPRKAAITREYLDQLMERDFPRYEALTKANPELKVWHLSDDH